MNEEVTKIAQKIINLEAIILAFLLPLFFLPLTSEFFEFNKLALLAVAVIFGYLAWGVKIVASGQIGFRRSPLDLPILFFWLTTMVTTVLSVHRISSLAGQFGRWHPSLISITLATLLYYLLSSNLEKLTIRRLGNALLASAVVSAILFLPQYFGINPLGQDWSNRPSFTPLGSVTTLAVFLGTAVSLGVREIVLRPERRRKILYALITILLFGSLILLNVPAGWLALIVAIGTALSSIKWPAFKRSWIYLGSVLAVGVILGAAAFFAPGFKKYQADFSREPHNTVLDLHTSWSIAATSFRQRPFWGSGPSTFNIDFTRYKPLRFNYTPYWASRFDKPISEYLLAFAEMGLLGVISYLFLIVVLVRKSVKATDKRLLPVAAGVLGSYLLTYANVASTFLLIVALASMAEIADRRAKRSPAKTNRREVIAAAVSITLLAAFLGLGLYRGYSAEFYLHRGLESLRKGDGSQSAFADLLNASQIFAQRDYYHTALANGSLAWANTLASTDGSTGEDEDTADTIQFLIGQTVQEAKRATELSPLNAANWENLAQIYINLIGFVENAEDWAINSYRQAIQLDLFNPLLRISLGGLYYQQQDYDRAVEQFRSAVDFKNDFANAYYNLGMAYRAQGKTDLAIGAIETAIRLSPRGIPGYEEAEAVLEELKSQQTQ